MSENTLMRAWSAAEKIPGGKALFPQVLRFVVPYTASIHPRIVELRPGFAKVEMRDRKALRNHLSCLHAAALFNLAEFTGNLAPMAGLSPKLQFIPVELTIQYFKKARGTITATCEAGIPETSERIEHMTQVHLHDEAGTEVARADVKLLVGPKAK